MSTQGPWDYFPEYFIPEDNEYKRDFLDDTRGYPKLMYIWRATHRENQSVVVFKAIHQDLADDPHKEKEENQILIEQTKNHSNLLKVIEVLYDPPPHWICYKLEYCEGGTLYDHIYNPQRRKALNPKRCLGITEGILQGLSHLHTCTDELVHRDLKLGNIFFCKNGVPKIGDYGLLESLKWRRFVSTAGTPGYKAPEKKYDKRSDIYSVGVILWEMIIGIHPFSNEAIGKSISNKQIEKIIKKAMDSNPNRRYQTAEEFFDAVKTLKEKL